MTINGTEERSLPDGWKEAQIDEVANLLRGVSYKKAVASMEPKDGHLPILRATNIQDENLVLEDKLVYVPQELVKDEQLLQKNDIVICMSSGSKHLVGKAARLTREWDGSFGTFCAAIRFDSAIEPSLPMTTKGTHQMGAHTGAPQPEVNRMAYDPYRHYRRSIRLKGYDYSQKGMYFVTICVQHGQSLLAETAVREMIQLWWEKLPEKFMVVVLDAFVIMPNHIHFIIAITDPVGAHPSVRQTSCRPMMGRPMMGRPMMGRPMMGRPMMGRPMMGRHIRNMMGRHMMGRHMMGRHMMGRHMMGRHMMGRHMGLPLPG